MSQQRLGTMVLMSSAGRPAGGIEFRAFRGTQRSSVYRSYEVDLDVFERILGAARREGQPGLAALRVEGSADLEPAVARQLAAELAQLRASAVLLDLDPVLVALAEVANWCARSREKAWLRISAG